MKPVRLLLFLSLLVAGLSACHKDDDDKFADVAGYYECYWGIGEDVPDNYERWELQKSGKLKAYYDDGEFYAEGSFSLDGTHFTAKYKSKFDNEYSFAGEFDLVNGELTGTWGTGNSSTNRGKFELYKE